MPSWGNFIQRVRQYLRSCPISFRILSGCLIVFLLTASYLQIISTVDANYYHLFDLTKYFTWTERGGGLYRKVVRADMDVGILSRDEWKEFSLQCAIVNPSNPGILFHFQSSSEYFLVYFNGITKTVVLARSQNGQLTPLIGPKALPAGETYLCQLFVAKQNARLVVNGEDMGSVSFSPASGKFGFFIKDNQYPPTVFTDVLVKGRLTDDRRVTAYSPYRGGVLGKKVWFLLFIFSGLFALAVANLSWILSGFRLRYRDGPIREERIVLPSDRHYYAYGVLLFLAVSIFWRFWRYGDFLVASYDNFGEIYPLFYYSRTEFLRWIHGGGFPLWNPYLHNGTPFFSSHWNMLYYPFNWPIFFLPNGLVFSGLTLKTFLEVFFSGVLCYRVLHLETGDRFWGLMGAISYQLCSVVLFALTLFPAMALYFSMSLYLYCLWSLEQRGRAANYFLLVFCIYLIMTSANVAFVFYAMLSLVVLTIYRLRSMGQGRAWAGLVTFAVGTGLLSSAVRWLPCLLAISESNRMGVTSQIIHDQTILFPRLFVPEMTGWIGLNGFNALESPDLHWFFTGLKILSSPHTAFFAYFGILSGIFFLMSFFLPQRSKKLFFWQGYVVVSMACVLLWQPLWGVLRILTFPFAHFCYHVITLPIGMAGLTAWVGKSLNDQRIPLNRTARFVGMSVLFVEAMILVFVTHVFPQITDFSRIVIILAASGTAVVWAVRTSRRPGSIDMKEKFWLFLDLLVWILILTTVLAVSSQTLAGKEQLFSHRTIPYLLMLLGGIWAYKGFNFFQKPNVSLSGSVCALALAALVIPWLVLGFWQTGFMQKFFALPEKIRVYAVDLTLAHLKLWLMLMAMAIILILLRRRIISGKVAGMILLVLVSADLLDFQSRFINIVAPSYYQKAFYSKRYSYLDWTADLRKTMNLVDGRVNGLTTIDAKANTGIMVFWPSHTGILGYLSKRYSDFATHFGFPKDSILISPDDDGFFSERFFDLCAVRYSFANRRQYLERPTAMSRLMMFYDFEVSADDAAVLERLSAADFDPLEKVVLSSDPGTGFAPQPGKAAERISLTQVHPERLRAEVGARFPAVLTFVESYDPGWQAFVDGAAVPMIRANFNFMAFPVPEGYHKIELCYRPRRFTMSLAASAVGLGLMIAGFGGYCLMGMKRRLHG